MKPILFTAIVLVATVACGQVLVVSDIPDQPTLAPADCPCLVCDCVDCPGDCVPKAKATPVSVVSRKAEIDRLESEVALLESLKPVSKTLRGTPDATTGGTRKSGTGVVRVSGGELRYIVVGKQRQCSSGQCRDVPIYGWRFYKVEPSNVYPSKAKAKTPIRFANTISDYAAPLPDGVVLESQDVAPTPSNSTGRTFADPSYYPANGPYAASYSSGYGCGGDMGSGCGGAGGGCGGGNGGRVGILGRLFGGRRR